MSAEPLPLFPLRAVLFPGGTAALRIFETRYIDLVRRCLRRDESFGVVAIRRGAEVGAAEPYRVGTLARIVDWTTTPDGLLGLKVRGGARYRFDSTDCAADGLYMAHGVSLMDERKSPLLASQLWARELLESLRKRDERDDGGEGEGSAGAGIELDDANAVCWNLAQRLPLGLGERQSLLEIEHIDERFERLRRNAAVLIDEYGKE